MTLWKPQHLPRQQPQPGVLPHFLAVLKQQLHADADAQQGPAAGGRLAHQVLEATAPQSCRARAKGANAGDDHAVRRPHLILVGCQHHRRADVLKSPLHIAQIANAVVDDRDHLVTP